MMRLSTVSLLSLPNGVWDQPTIQAVIGLPPRCMRLSISGETPNGRAGLLFRSRQGVAPPRTLRRARSASKLAPVALSARGQKMKRLICPDRAVQVHILDRKVQVIGPQCGPCSQTVTHHCNRIYRLISAFKRA